VATPSISNITIFLLEHERHTLGALDVALQDIDCRCAGTWPTDNVNQERAQVRVQRGKTIAALNDIFNFGYQHARRVGGQNSIWRANPVEFLVY
jgi:hypothetical protein